jgi:subtilisin family serine protease
VGEGEGGPATPVRILVKLKPEFAGPLESALPTQSLTLGVEDPAPVSVQAFLRRHRASRLEPLHAPQVRAKRRRGASDRDVAAGIRRRFAERARRARGAFEPPDLSRTYVLRRAAGSEHGLREALTALARDPAVEWAEEDRLARASAAVNDPYFSSRGSWGQVFDDLYGIKKTGAPAAWDLTAGEGVVVAVVDTGVDYDHPDLAHNVWTNAQEIPGNGLDDDGNGYVDDVRGWDFIGTTYSSPAADNDPRDGHGHGTHVAGTIAAEGNAKASSASPGRRRSWP